MEPKGGVAALVERIAERAGNGEGVSIGAVQSAAGRRAIGPLLLFPALLVISPLSIIPGLPTLVGVSVVLVAGQVALGRVAVWLPGWLREKRLSPNATERLLGFLRPVGRLLDRFCGKRLGWAMSEPVVRLAAGVCVMVGALLPIMEFIPFASTWAGVIVAVFALALTMGDGLLMLIWMLVLIAVIGMTAALLF